MRGHDKCAAQPTREQIYQQGRNQFAMKMPFGLIDQQ
jgi:hypothetical protein